MKILLLISSFVLMGFSSCKTGAPKPPEKLIIYVSFPEDGLICRRNDKKVEYCIDTRSDDFKDFVAMHIDEMAKITNYIIELNGKCKKWETK